MSLQTIPRYISAFLTLALIVSAHSGMANAEPAPAAPAVKKHRKKASASHKGKARGRKSKKSARHRRGRDSARSPRNAGIESDRINEIQAALIKTGYLSGPSTGQYDEATSAAMKRFQTDRGLAATGLPSAGSLKALGVRKNTADGYSTPVKRASESSNSGAQPKQENQP